MAVSLTGVVLAAGRSTRMGCDKALLPAPDGGPMWARQRDVLAGAGAEEILLSARPEQPWVAQAKGFAALVVDGFSVGGPIIGVTAALERAAHPHLAVLAIDLPKLPAAWFAALREDCARGVGAVGRHGDFFEPLAAIYPRELKWLAWEALAKGDYSLQKLVAAGIAAGLLRERKIGPAETPWFENRNGPDAAAAAAELKAES
ncbi:MAG: hypothetical protein B9S34_13405 [Opitutia bacterium Tous-C1TDCM]|nr:MAG: hypothetical protein B9S34_13405 [Opitutae bacterium Tous-C1TDCM]